MRRSVHASLWGKAELPCGNLNRRHGGHGEAINSAKPQRQERLHLQLCCNCNSFGNCNMSSDQNSIGKCNGKRRHAVSVGVQLIHAETVASQLIQPLRALRACCHEQPQLSSRSCRPAVLLNREPLDSSSHRLAVHRHVELTVGERDRELHPPVEPRHHLAEHRAIDRVELERVGSVNALTA
jgi:hypothetical protein